ncbi:hypothetical protein [Herbaspirillum rubrisubalbicans]|uniref:hypothetical protein n=1 Tax=Herbaspirillum rubrisubalbicans TaxID=80842 RepID=UPI0011BD86E5|nr:hypothetical protein [Herbaspirillum rubrisubalbicans]
MNRGIYAIVGEDDVCRALGQALIRQAQIPAQEQMALAAGGFGPFRSKIEKMNEVAARSMPVLMIADGDQDTCPVRQIGSWKPRHQAPRLQIRLAVREAESWLLADHTAFADFAGISEAAIPRSPDEIVDCKSALLRLISRSRKRILRDEMLREGQIKPGLGYNFHLISFIENNWVAERAAERSQSVARAIPRVREIFSP